MNVKRTINALLIAMLFAYPLVEANAAKRIKATASTKTSPDSRLKRCYVPGEFYVTTNGVIFECWTTGVWNIELTDDYGEVIYSGTISAVANESYFLYVPGLDPDEDEIDGL
ncbi:MAG: hypothetical protein MJZ15_01890 [Bacteroidales bacterium]|nr:hypothetical protein [Bacteroidales bacterium]